MLNKLANKILIVVLFFSYIYEIQYNIFPWDFPVMLGLVGIILYVISPRIRIYCYQQDWKVLKLSMVFIPILIVSLLSIIINKTSDLYFVKLAILTPIRIFGLIPIMLLIKHTYGKIHYTTIIWLFLICGIIQMFLAISMWLIPSLKNNLYTLLASSELSDMILEKTDGFRLNGFGTNFFGSGIVHGFMLILAILLLLTKNTTMRSNIMVMFICIILFLGGMMMARTTLVGACFAIIIYLLSQRNWLSNFKLFLGFLLIISLSIMILSRISTSLFGQFESLFEFGFEMFFNYFAWGEVSTSSTDIMMNMYIFPKDFYTWLLGDGLWTDSLTGFYYMGTDIGYCRMIFYFGIIGTLTFFICCKKMIAYISNRGIGINKSIFFIIFILICTLNLKGFTSMFTLLSPFYFCDKINNL